MSRFLTLPVLVLVGILAFAIVLAVLLSNLLIGEAGLIVLGMALGTLIGVPLGAIAYRMGFRHGQSSAQDSGRPTLRLTPDESELLMRALERQQTSPGAFGLTTRQTRPITSVGGADLSALSGETESSEQ